MLRFDKWNSTTSTVETVRYVINGANQIQCIDADASGTCDGTETVWELSRSHAPAWGRTVRRSASRESPPITLRRLDPAQDDTVTASPTPEPTATASPTPDPVEIDIPDPVETDTPDPVETDTPALPPTEVSQPGAAEGAHNWHYEYDNLSRGTLACSDGWDDVAETCAGDAFTYEYDGGGNLLRFDKWNADTSTVDTVRYVINGANQIQCIDADASGQCDGSETVWEYDAYGNLLDDGSTQYTYDAANRLSSITTASGTTTYGYNGDNDRISQSVNGTLTTYILDTATPLTMVLSETNASTGETTFYWHALDTLAQSDGTSVEYFGYDGLGSVRQLVGESGSVGLAQTFDAYGNGYAKSGSAASSFGYSGEQTDSNGFVYLRARYYQPGMGRFTQMDPSRLERNAYLYSMSNPIRYVDLLGLCGNDATQQDNDKCEALAQKLEAAYSLIVYWPSRDLPDTLVDILEGMTCYCDEKIPHPNCAGGNPLVAGRQGYNSRYKGWRYKELYSMSLAIQMYESQLGRKVTQAFLANVVFIRVDKDVNDTYGVVGKGRYWEPSDENFPLRGFGGRAAISITDFGTGTPVRDINNPQIIHQETNSQMTWTFVHEMAHRVDYFARKNNLYNTLGSWEDVVGNGPTIYAGSNDDEDIAESITWYVWNRQSQKFTVNEQKRFLWWTSTSTRQVLNSNPNGAGNLVGGREQIVEALFDAYKAKYPPQCGSQVWDYRDLPGGW